MFCWWNLVPLIRHVDDIGSSHQLFFSLVPSFLGFPLFYNLLGSSIRANWCHIILLIHVPPCPHTSLFWTLCIEVSIKFTWMFGQGEWKPVFIGRFVGVLVRRKCSVATLKSVWKRRQTCITTDANKWLTRQLDSLVRSAWTCTAARFSL